MDRRLIVALDVGDCSAGARIIDMLAPLCAWFKIGSVLFTREGPAVCRLVKDAGAGLFLDLKFHDIPNTVYGAVRAAMDLGVDMLTVHSSGGPAMLEAARRARDESGVEAVVVGVTVLTHLEIGDFRALFGSTREANETVLALARTVRGAGLDGVVASARELPAIKSECGTDFKVVTPGIRLPEGNRDDQSRVVTPKQAIRDGADFIVVGRPIIAAPDPAAACQKILADMSV